MNQVLFPCLLKSINFHSSFLILHPATKCQAAVSENGLRIITLSTTSPMVHCRYQLNVGTANKLPNEEGIAHFCGHVAFKGTTHRATIDVIQCLEQVRGGPNTLTTKTSTVYYSAILKDHLPRVIDLLTDIVSHSIHPQKEINKEVEVICDEIESYNDNPAELIYDEFENITFRGHSLGHSILGTAGRVRKFTVEGALRFTQKHYQSMNSVFFAHDDVDFGNLPSLLEKRNHSKVRIKGGTEEPIEAPLPALSGYQPQIVKIDKYTHQAHVMIGNRAYSIHNKRRMALYLLNNILGGPGMSARLNLALRERRELVYTVESSIVSYSLTGIWSIYLGCDVNGLDECIRLVHTELDRFIDIPLIDDELSIAKQQIKGQIGIACDNRESLVLDFAKGFPHYGWKKDISALCRNIDTITAEEVQAVARELFPEERLTKLICI